MTKSKVFFAFRSHKPQTELCSFFFPLGHFFSLLTALISAGTETIELEKVGASSTVKSRVQQAKKAGLTVLDLSGCDLKDLPTIVVESPVWTSLDLGFNKYAF